MDPTSPIQRTAALAAQSTIAVEARSRLSDSVFHAAFECAPTAMSICRIDGFILEANQATARLLGCKTQDLNGSNLWHFGIPEFAEGRNQKLREIDKVEGRFRRCDGSEFQAQVTLSRLETDGPCLGTWKGRGNGDSPLLLALLEDVGERQQMTEALRQAEKMEVIGRLAAGIAHDFNNLLTGIFLYSDLLLAQLPSESPQRHFAEELQMASEQGSGLTRQLMAVLRKQGSGPGPIAVNDVIGAMERLLRHMIGEQIEVLFELDPALGSIVAEEAELRQIVLNLALNARDALDRGQKPGAKIRVCTRIPKAGVIQLIVEDNGCGMTANIRDHLFEPLFTTKKVGEGTGLGLATVKRVVGELGGKIEVVTAPDCGTRIEVCLPSAQRFGEKVQASVASNSTIVHSQVI